MFALPMPVRALTAVFIYVLILRGTKQHGLRRFGGASICHKFIEKQ